MTVKRLTCIILSLSAIFSQAAYGGWCMDYEPKIESLTTAPATYLQTDDPWAAVFSPVVNIAGNPSTPESILTELSGNRLNEVRVAVAKNPNTPRAALDGLFKDARLQVQAAVLWNPSAPQEYYEAFLSQNDLKHHELLADCWRTPSAVIERLHAQYRQLNPYSSDSAKSIFSRLAANPGTPQQVLKELFKFTSTREVLVAFGDNPRLIGEMASSARAGKLAEFKRAYGLPPNDTVIEQVLLSLLLRQRYKNNPPIINGRLAPELLIASDKPNADRSFQLLRATYAADAGIPTAVMEDLLRDVKGKTANSASRAVIANPKLPKKELDQFCSSKDHAVRLQVASNPNITRECFRTLTSEFMRNGKLDMRDKDEWNQFHARFELLRNLITNPAGTTELLMMTLYHEERFQFEHELFPVAINGLLQRPQVPVQKMVPALLNEEKKMLERFSLYDDREVPGAFATRGLDKLSEYKKSLDKRLAALQSDQARLSLLQELSRSDSIILRAYAAGSPLTPAGVLEQLADDKTLFVKLELAKNDRLSESLARKLINVQDLIVFDKIDTSFE